MNYMYLSITEYDVSLISELINCITIKQEFL